MAREDRLSFIRVQDQEAIRVVEAEALRLVCLHVAGLS